jgi:hypothetical protein
MTYIVSTLKNLFSKRPATSSDPVYNFFFDTSSGERKKVYMKALRKAQAEQQRVTHLAKEKVRA